MKRKKKKRKSEHTMSEAERAAWKVVALRHHFHEPYEKTPAQIKADEYAKKHPQPQKPKVVSASRRPFARVIYTPMGGQNRY